MKRHVLLIGGGSAGQRFFHILQKKGEVVTLFDHRQHQEHIVTRGIDGAIIASPPATHADYARKLLQNHIPMLIEKPIATTVPNAQEILRKSNSRVFVMTGLNLRFLPAVRHIGLLIQQKRLGSLLTATIHAGYYLPWWRSKPYQQTYSASYGGGGGVALDLIHEIDLALHWFGPFIPKTIIKRKQSELRIDCEDFVQIIADRPFPITITLDYLSHIHTRRYTIIGTKGTIFCDIYKHYLQYTSSDKKTRVITKTSFFDIEKTYESEIDTFLANLETKPLITERDLGIDALAIALKARRHVPRK